MMSTISCGLAQSPALKADRFHESLLACFTLWGFLATLDTIKVISQLLLENSIPTRCILCFKLMNTVSAMCCIPVILYPCSIFGVRPFTLSNLRAPITINKRVWAQAPRSSSTHVLTMPSSRFVLNLESFKQLLLLEHADSNQRVRQL